MFKLSRENCYHSALNVYKLTNYKNKNYLSIKHLLTITCHEVNFDARLNNLRHMIQRGEGTTSAANAGHEQNTMWRGLQPLDDGHHDNLGRAALGITVVEKAEHLLDHVKGLLLLNTNIGH